MAENELSSAFAAFSLSQSKAFGVVACFLSLLTEAFLATPASF